MEGKVHKLFTTRCVRGGERLVTASECARCPHGSVVDMKSRVLCSGETRFFTTPCYDGTRAAATLRDCEECEHGRIVEDRLRVICNRL